MSFEILNFSEKVTGAENVSQILWLVYKELRANFNMKGVFLAHPERNLLYYVQGYEVRKKKVLLPWPSSKSLNTTWQRFLAEEFRRPFAWACSLPIETKPNKKLSNGPVLIFEHSLKGSLLETFEKFWSIRVKILSRSILLALRAQDLRSKIALWKQAFDKHSEPLSIDHKGQVIYSNKAFKNIEDPSHFEKSTFPVPWKAKKDVEVHNYKNIYNEKLLRAEIWQKEKMALLGKKFKNLSCQINLSLSQVLKICDGLLDELEVWDLRRVELEHLKQTVGRCRDTASDLVSFGSSKGSYESFCLEEVARQATKFLKIQLAERDFHFEISPNLPQVVGSKGLFGQVLFNLLLNAYQATGPGDSIALRIFLKKPFVAICVEDKGVGMSEKVQKNIFRPFFTTKKLGQGTGLGLYLCQKVVESFKGQIKVKSQKSLGTQFWIYLPQKK